MAKYHSRLITGVCSHNYLGAFSLALMLTCSHSHAQEPPSPAPVENTTSPIESKTKGSSAAPATPPSQRLASEARRLLANITTPPAPVWISVNGEDVLGFWQPDLSGAPIGAVLMLHAHGHTPRWPETLLNLHQFLPRFGWATLSIELPAPAPLTVPPRASPTVVDTPSPTSSSDGSPQETEQEEPQSAIDEAQAAPQEGEEGAVVENTEDTAATASAEDTESTAMAIIQAAFEYLQQQNQYNIVLLGEGLGAARALRFAESATLGTPQAQSRDGTTSKAVVDRPIRSIVMLDATLAEGSEHAPSLLLNHPQIPMMDLITTVNFDVRGDAAWRKQMSRKMRYQTYTVRRIMPQSGVNDRDRENEVTKNVRGFITRHAKGVEL